MFTLVWVITASLFLWGLSTRFFALRDYAKNHAAAVTSIDYATLKKNIDSNDSKLHLVHIWATWCEPCVREIPMYAQIQQKYGHSGVRLYLISADDRADLRSVESFLKEKGIHFPTFILGEDANAFMKALNPAWSGALPTSFIFKPGGALHSMVLGETSEEQLKNKLDSALKAP